MSSHAASGVSAVKGIFCSATRESAVRAALLLTSTRLLFSLFFGRLPYVFCSRGQQDHGDCPHDCWRVPPPHCGRELRVLQDRRAEADAPPPAVPARPQPCPQHILPCMYTVFSPVCFALSCASASIHTTSYAAQCDPSVLACSLCSWQPTRPPFFAPGNAGVAVLHA